MTPTIKLMIDCIQSIPGSKNEEDRKIYQTTLYVEYLILYRDPSHQRQIVHQVERELTIMLILKLLIITYTCYTSMLNHSGCW